MQITDADPNAQQLTNVPLIGDTIQEGFITEARTRRLARKHRRRWQIRSSDSSSEEDVDKTTSVDGKSEICSETLEVQAITPANEKIDLPSETSGEGAISPAHDEINAASQSSGGWAITPANDHESSQTSAELAIPPAKDENHKSSWTSGERAIPPANNDNYESSWMPGERAIPLLNDEIHSSSQTSGKRATPPSNEKIPPASKPCQPSEICILPPTNTTSEVCNPDQPSTSTGITHTPVSEGIDDSPNTWTLKEQCHISRIFSFCFFLLFYKLALLDELHYFHLILYSETTDRDEITVTTTFTSGLDLCIFPCFKYIVYQINYFALIAK